MHQTSDDENDVVNHVTVCTKVQEGREWRISMSTHKLPRICKPAGASIHDRGGMQWWSLVHQVGTVVCTSLQSQRRRSKQMSTAKRKNTSNTEYIVSKVVQNIRTEHVLTKNT